MAAAARRWMIGAPTSSVQETVMGAGPIIVGIDAGQQGHECAALARAVAEAAGSPLELIAAYDVSANGDRMTGARLDALREQAVAALVVAEALLGGVEVSARPRPSCSPGEALQQEAGRSAARLIVAGPARRVVDGRSVTDPVTLTLLDGAPCPVAVPPLGYAGTARLRRIAVAFTDAPEGCDALAGGAALADALGAELHAFMVAAPAHERRAAALLAAAAHEVDRPMTTEVVTDGSAAALAQISGGFDLVVCGSDEDARLHTTAAGGCARRLLGAARCPVVVVPRGMAVEDPSSPAAPCGFPRTTGEAPPVSLAA